MVKKRIGADLIPWQPYRELDNIERRFDDIWGRPVLPSLWRHMPEDWGWLPAVDIYDKKDKVIVKAEIPGMNEDDIDISVEGNMLIIKGEKERESEVNEEDYYRSECSYGSFVRSIALPSTVNDDKIEAKYVDGVLEITLPKKAEAKPKKVKVATEKKSK